MYTILWLLQLVLSRIAADGQACSHCVMDYYYALWQTVNPEILYSENQPGTDTIDFPLAPFNRAAPVGSWTSRMIQRSPTHDPKYVFIPSLPHSNHR